MVPKTKEELEEDVDAAPDWLKEEAANNTLKYSELTSSLIIDVGINPKKPFYRLTLNIDH